MSDDKIHVFISHRHIDKAVADVFRHTLEDWSNGLIKVYQSSAAESSSRISEELDDAIAGAIASSSIVLLIYTEAPGDMDWCMYECGLSQDPSSRTTRVMVFHSTEHPPEPLDGLISMRLEPESVLQFAHAFHYDPGVFPDHGKAVAPDASEDLVSSRASELHEALRKAAPDRVEETAVYDRLTLGLEQGIVDRIRDIAEGQRLADLYEATERELSAGLFVRDHSGDPQEHFNYDQIKPGFAFHDFVERWLTDSDYAEVSEWHQGVYDAITRAILHRPERAVTFPFDSLDSDGGNWLLPVLSRYRVIPHEALMEFELLFCRLNREAAMRMLPDAST